MTMNLNRDEGLIGRVTFFIDHGLLIVEDRDSADLHDDWNAANDHVSAVEDSLYLAVRPSVDGPVEIGVFQTDDPDSDGEVYFDGTLRTTSGWIVIHDANDVMRFTIRRPRGLVGIRILVDRANFVSQMRITISKDDLNRLNAVLRS